MGTFLDPKNRLFVLARQGRCQPSALAAIAVVVVIAAFVVVGQAVSRALFRSSLVENTVGFLPIYLGLWIWLRLSSKRPFWSLGFEGRSAPRKVFRGALLAGLMISITASLAIIPGALLTAGRWKTSGVGAIGIALLSLLSYAVQGSAEEVLFRGWLLPALGARYRPWIGVLGSALVFSVAHTPNTIGAPLPALALLNLFLFGTFAAFYALAGGWVVGDMRVACSLELGDGRSVGVFRQRQCPFWRTCIDLAYRL